ncbi:MAG: hypothetical protein ABII22_05825 [Candidatus Micrarchaeota archaeon]
MEMKKLILLILVFCLFGCTSNSDVRRETTLVECAYPIDHSTSYDGMDSYFKQYFCVVDKAIEEKNPDLCKHSPVFASPIVSRSPGASMNDEKTCIQDVGKVLDYQAFNQAILLMDPKYCYEIKYEEFVPYTNVTRYNCFERVLSDLDIADTTREDLIACDDMESYQCYYYFAALFEDKSLCDKISSKYHAKPKEHCVLNVDRSLNGFNSTSEYKEDDYYFGSRQIALAISSKNLSLCNEISLRHDFFLKFRADCVSSVKAIIKYDQTSSQ